MTRIPDRLIEAFFRYPWPGNVHELKHVIERYLILPDEETVVAELAWSENADGPGPYPPPTSTTTHASVPLGCPALSARDGNGDGQSADGRDGVPPAPRRKGKIPLKSIAAKAAEDAEKRIILQVL